MLGLLVGSVFLVHSGPEVVTHVHRWRQQVDWGRRGMLTTMDFTQRFRLCLAAEQERPQSSHGAASGGCDRQSLRLPQGQKTVCGNRG